MKELSTKQKRHTKSKRGCRNCKLRKVKCDETHPGCKNCMRYSVACNYNQNGPELQTTTELLYRADALSPSVSVCSVNETIAAMMNSSISFYEDSSRLTPYQFQVQDLSTLSRFQERTVLTISSSQVGCVYQRELIQLMTRHPHLLHAIFAITLMHDRYVSVPIPPRATPLEAYHIARSTSLLNAALSKPLDDSSRDAIFSSAILLTAVSICSFESTAPEDVWPLRVVAPGAQPEQIHWLRMKIGVLAIANATNPTRPGGLLTRVTPSDGIEVGLGSGAAESAVVTPLCPARVAEMHAIPAKLRTLCNVDAASNARNNAYDGVVRALLGLWDLECNGTTILTFYVFTQTMTPECIQLLEGRDPRALLLLAYWFGMVCEWKWWLAQRARVEGRAICLWLERRLNNGGVERAEREQWEELLVFPKQRLGMVALGV